MNPDDWVGLAVVVIMYGSLAVVVWVKGWRWCLDTLRGLLDGLNDAVRAVAKRLEDGAAGPRPARQIAAEGLCTCPWEVHWDNRPVPITSTVTGEVIDHRCPVCWLPRRPERVSPPRPTLPDPGFTGHRWGGSVPPQRPAARPAAPRGWSGGVADDPQGPGFTGGPR